MIVNELGTAMAANPENLNDAIRAQRAGARRLPRGDEDPRPPAHASSTGSTSTPSGSISRLAGRRDDVVATIAEGRDAAEAAPRAAPTSRPTSTRSTTSSPSCARRSRSSARPRAPGRPLLAQPARRGSGARRALDAAARLQLGERARGGRPRRCRGPRPARARPRPRRDRRPRAGRARTLRPTAEILADFLTDLDDPAPRRSRRTSGPARSCDDPTLACWGTGPQGRRRATRASRRSSTTSTTSRARSTSSTRSATSSSSTSSTSAAGPCGGFNAGPTVPARGGGRDDRHHRGRPLRLLDRRQPARHQLRPRPAPLRQLRLPARLDRPRALRPEHLDPRLRRAPARGQARRARSRRHRVERAAAAGRIRIGRRRPGAGRASARDRGPTAVARRTGSRTSSGCPTTRSTESARGWVATAGMEAAATAPDRRRPRSSSSSSTDS